MPEISDSFIASVGRENLERIQDSLKTEGIDALALTDVWSHHPIVFVPIFDIDIPDIVLVPSTGEPIVLTPHWGLRTVREETWVADENILAFDPYPQGADGQADPNRKHETVLDEAFDKLPEEHGQIGVDTARTSHARYRSLESHYDGSLVNASDLLNEVLGPKTDNEITLIEEAVTVAEAGVREAIDEVTPGMSEFDVAATAENVMRRAGDRLFPFDYHYGSGPHSLQPGRRVSDRVLEAGEFLTIDVLPLVNGYFSDICRTIIVGDDEPTPEQREVYETVLAAHEVINEKVRPGVPVAELDNAIRQHFAKEGYDGKFLHHSGHGVGTVYGPDLTPTNDATFQKNHVVAIEPGLYVDGVGGVRIEDVFVVTESGPESMMEYPKRLI